LEDVPFFLRLARWFSAADDEQAHRLYDAAFGAYPARHLLFWPDEPDPRIGPTLGRLVRPI
jgi:hypothetical protein